MDVRYFISIFSKNRNRPKGIHTDRASANQPSGTMYQLNIKHVCHVGLPEISEEVKRRFVSTTLAMEPYERYDPIGKVSRHVPIGTRRVKVPIGATGFHR